VARQKSADKRTAILEAAIRVIVGQGLSAPTAVIASEAGIANGSLFTYFQTKADLYNQLYLELKREMVAASLEGFPAKGSLKSQVFHFWRNWLYWALHCPEKRRALALLGVSDDITAATRAAVFEGMGPINELFRQAHARGAMKNAPFALATALGTALAEAAMDYVVKDPGRADEHCKNGFEAFWRMIG
jgi:AcrR family transcriptional regulator